MPKAQQSWVRSQHPPTQWNLRGGRWSSVEYRMWKKRKPCVSLDIYSVAWAVENLARPADWRLPGRVMFRIPSHPSDSLFYRLLPVMHIHTNSPFTASHKLSTTNAHFLLNCNVYSAGYLSPVASNIHILHRATIYLFFPLRIFWLYFLYIFIW
jgi:hypothetical protein